MLHDKFMISEKSKFGNQTLHSGLPCLDLDYIGISGSPHRKNVSVSGQKQNTALLGSVRFLNRARADTAYIHNFPYA